jgi:hypothetical protein
MEAFHVWVRPLGGICRVRVEGAQNAQWLLARLGHSFVFKTADPMREETDSSCCTFCVAYGPQVSRATLESAIAGIPEVVLMSDPA